MRVRQLMIACMAVDVRARRHAWRIAGAVTDTSLLGNYSGAAFLDSLT